MYNRVKGSSYPGSSALGALPPLKCQDDLGGAAVDETIDTAVNEISENLTWYLENNEGNTVLGAFGSFPPWIHGHLNFEQANKVIQHLNTEFKFLGALHIPSINSILFQTGFGSFSLEYGPEVCETSCHILHHEFDEDRGFIPLDEILPSQEEEYSQKITKVLQEYYTKWCLNNREGFIIPDIQNCVLSDSNRTESSYWEYGKAALPVILAAGLFAYRIYRNGATPDDINAFIPKI